MSSCSGDNRRQVWREFFRCRPLIESRVGTAPHRNFAIAKWLFCEPFDQIVPVPWVIYKRLEFAARISATANIDERKRIAMRCEVSSARVVTVRDVRRQCEDDRRHR